MRAIRHGTLRCSVSGGSDTDLGAQTRPKWAEGLGCSIRIGGLRCGHVLGSPSLKLAVPTADASFATPAGSFEIEPRGSKEAS